MPHTTENAKYATSHHSADQSLLVCNMRKQQRTRSVHWRTQRPSSPERLSEATTLTDHVYVVWSYLSCCTLGMLISCIICPGVCSAAACWCGCHSAFVPLSGSVCCTVSRRSSSLTGLPVLRPTYYKGPRRLRPPARVRLRRGRAWTSSLPRPSVGPRIDPLSLKCHQLSSPYVP